MWSNKEVRRFTGHVRRITRRDESEVMKMFEEEYDNLLGRCSRKTQKARSECIKTALANCWLWFNEKPITLTIGRVARLRRSALYFRGLNPKST